MSNKSINQQNSQPSIFKFEQSEVRVISIDGEPWFVAKDVCGVLDIKNVSQTLTKLRTTQKSSIILNDGTEGNPNIAIVSEGGMYRLVLKSRKKQAEAFQAWVEDEVLPSIRKTGKYSVNEPQPEPTTPKTYLEALKALVASEEEKERLKVEKERLSLMNDDLESDVDTLTEVVDELFDHSSIIRIAKFNGVSETKFKWRALKAETLRQGLEVKKVPCPRFVTKNLYPHSVWEQCYPDAALPGSTSIVLRTK